MLAMPKIRTLMAVALVGGVGTLAACSDATPSQMTATTTEETTTSQAPMQTPTPAPMLVPGTPGTVTTRTTHSETVP
jgi:hypothetical protein